MSMEIGNGMTPMRDFGIGASDLSQVGGVQKELDADDAVALRFMQARAAVANELGIPDIDGATLTVSEMEECLESVTDKLTDQLASAKGKKVMFDIYALMSLVQEMSQEMRNALREVRQLENQSIQMNLKQQAEVQRYAAMTAAIAGGVLCAVQGVVTAGLTVGTIKQMSSQNQVMENNGVNVYDKQSRMAQNVGDQRAANMQAMKLARDNPELWGQTKMTNAESAQTTLNKASETVTVKEQALTQAQSEAQAARSALGDIDVNSKESLQKIASGEAKKPEGGNYSIQERAKALESLSKIDRVETAEAKVAQLTEELETAKTDLQAAKDAMPAALQKDVDSYAAKYDAVRSRANVEQETTGKVSEQTKTELTKAEKQLEIARAKQVANIANMRASGDLPASAETDLKTAADVRYARATAKSQSGIEATKNQRSIMKLQMIQTLNMTIGQYTQQLVGSLQQMIGAEAIELQAEQKMTEDQMDQVKDLMQQELSVIQKTFELFASVVSKESQTIEGIIRA